MLFRMHIGKFRNAVFIELIVIVILLCSILSIGFFKKPIVVSADSKIVANTSAMYQKGGVLITAAHIPSTQIPSRYTLMYSEKEEDIAYYIDKSYRGGIAPLEPVIIEGLKDAKIVQSFSGYFMVYVSDPTDIVAGMSGHTVVEKYTNKPIGFISELAKGGLLKCTSIY